ncbi:MAG: hypothetical protein RQ757_02675 [Pseudomonadales bacterium]|nr:hypothetical protein [Pseudomonadales bacterium]
MIDLVSIASHMLFLLVGATITGLASYLFRTEGAAAAIAREQAARKLALMEELAHQAGIAHQSFQRYFTLVQEAIRFKENWPRQRREELDAISLQLVEAINQLATAESTLLLLHEKLLSKALRNYTNRIATFKKSQYARSDASDEVLNEQKQQIIALRDKFFELLSERYSRKDL